MNEKLHTALLSLQEDLEQIKNWLEILKQTEGAAKDVIKSVAKILEKTTKLIDRIHNDSTETWKTLNTTAAATQKVLEKTALQTQTDIKESTAATQATLINKADETKNTVESAASETKTVLIDTAKKTRKDLQDTAAETQDIIQRTTSELMIAVQEMLRNYEELGKATSALVEYLRSVNFPSRLDKIDASISAISLGVNNLSDKLDRFRDQWIAKIEEEHRQTRALIAPLQDQLKQARQRQNLYFGLLIATQILIGAAFAVYFMTKG